MTMSYTPSGYLIEAEFVFADGKWALAAATKDGLSYVYLWADITPTTLADGDYTIDAVHVGSQYGMTIETLSGEAEAEAKAILKADPKWCAWAREEAAERVTA